MFLLTWGLRIMKEMFDTLILSGGAQYVTAFIGAIRYLEHTGLRPIVRHVIGSSAGAILGLLFVLGLSSDDMASWVNHLIEHDQLNQLNLDQALNFIDVYGLDGGKNIESAIERTLAKYARLDKMTFRQLMQQTADGRGRIGRIPVELIVCTLNVTLGRFEYLSVDASPDLDITTAIRMSTAIPLLYAPVVHGGYHYVDPLFGRNLPFDCPHRPCGGNSRVLGIRTISFSTSDPSTHRVSPDSDAGSIVSFLARLMNIIMDQANPRPSEFKMLDIKVDTARVQDFSLETMTFAWSAAQTEYLIHTGYCHAKALLDGAVRSSLSLGLGSGSDPQLQSGSQADELLHHEDQEDS